MNKRKGRPTSDDDSNDTAGNPKRACIASEEEQQEDGKHEKIEPADCTNRNCWVCHDMQVYLDQRQSKKAGQSNKVSEKTWRPPNKALNQCWVCAGCNATIESDACGPCHFCTNVAHHANSLLWMDPSAFKTNPIDTIHQAKTARWEFDRGYQHGYVRVCKDCQYEAEMHVMISDHENKLCWQCTAKAKWYSYDMGWLKPTCEGHTSPARPLACVYWSHHLKTTGHPDSRCPMPTCPAHGGHCSIASSSFSSSSDQSKEKKIEQNATKDEDPIGAVLAVVGQFLESQTSRSAALSVVGNKLTDSHLSSLTEDLGF